MKVDAGSIIQALIVGLLLAVVNRGCAIYDKVVILEQDVRVIQQTIAKP